MGMIQTDDFLIRVTKVCPSGFNFNIRNKIELTIFINGSFRNLVAEMCIRDSYKHFGVRPIVLIDEYDTPLIEAYTDGYWDEMITTCRQLFHNTLKENDYLGRAIITGVTKVSKNSLFYDLNNLLVATVTDDIYTDCCGSVSYTHLNVYKRQVIYCLL